jgi:chromate transporter
VIGRIGLTGYGGPAVTISMMEEEAVARRHWLTREQYLDLVGITNLIPGPNATEIALHLGHLRAGLPGLLLSGLCFIVPAAVSTTFFAWLYVRYGTLPQAGPFLYGIKPVVLAVILSALWRLGRSALKGWRLLAVALGVTLLAYLGLNEVLALFAGGLLGMLALLQGRGGSPPLGAKKPGICRYAMIPPLALGGRLAAAAPSLGGLALFFLKVGAVLYGSGYVLIAFLQGGLVRDYHWLSQQQLLDAVAVGQFTPGPLLSTAAFVGYLLFGLPGAALSTAAIFAPSFIFVLATVRLVPRVRRSPQAAAFLDAINASALALMVMVAVQLGRAALVDWPAMLIAALGAFVALRWKVNSTWLVLGGGLAGWLTSLLAST